MNTIPKLVPLFLCGISLFSATWLGCKRAENPATEPGVLRVHLSAEPVSLDPALVEDGLSMRILNNLMDGLIGYDNTGKLVNRLADSVRISPDRLRYEFKIRADAAWSDGRVIRAEDFVAGIRRALKAGSGSKLSHLLFPIRGARKFQAGQLRPEKMGVRAEAGKLIVELERPVAFWLDVMTQTVAMPIREDVLAQNEGRWLESGPVTGPYRLVSHLADRQIVLEANSEYWGDSVLPRKTNPDRPKKIVFQLVQDDSTAVSLYDKGRLDLLGKVPPFDYARFQKSKELKTEPFLATYYLAFNVRKPPFSDRELRRAIAGVIRREEIVSALSSGELPARSWIPRGLEGYIAYQDPAPVFASSVEAVKKRTTDAMRASVSFAFDSSSRNSIVMEKVQQDLLRHLNFKVGLEHSDWKSYVGRLTHEPPSAYRFGCQAPFMDPIFHLQIFTTNDPNNYTGWSNAEYDRLVREIEVTPRGPVREKKILKAQEILVDREAIVIPIFHYVQANVISKRIGGFQPNPFGVVRFDEVQLKD